MRNQEYYTRRARRRKEFILPCTQKDKEKEGPVRADLFLDLCRFAQTIAQIVQLCSADLAVTDGLDVDDVGSVNRENLLAADTVGDTANGDGFLNAAMLLGNDGALENLNSLAGTFLNLDMNTNRIADVHFGQFLLHVLAGQSLHQIHCVVLLQIKTFMPLGNAAAPQCRLWQRTVLFTDLDILAYEFLKSKSNFKIRAEKISGTFFDFTLDKPECYAIMMKLFETAMLL